jgi:hypothetical protein
MLYKESKNQNYKKNYIIFIFLIILSFIIYYEFFISNIKKIYSSNEFNIDKEFFNYERNLITEEMKKNAQWDQFFNEPFFINGIIRKYKPKNCLEIGVSRGGGSIIILNAIKDIEGSSLISLDLNAKLYNNQSEYTGCNVKKYFPQLANNNKWKLYTGKQPHIFLDEINI